MYGCMRRKELAHARARMRDSRWPRAAGARVWRLARWRIWRRWRRTSFVHSALTSGPAGAADEDEEEAEADAADDGPAPAPAGRTRCATVATSPASAAAHTSSSIRRTIEIVEDGIFIG